VSVEARKDLSGEYVRLVPLLLGLGRTLDKVSEELLSEAGSPGDASGAVDERITFAALGILSFRGTLRRWLSHASSDRAGRHESNVTESTATTARNLLR
jgi:hypothetical protein